MVISLKIRGDICGSYGVLSDINNIFKLVLFGPRYWILFVRLSIVRHRPLTHESFEVLVQNMLTCVLNVGVATFITNRVKEKSRKRVRVAEVGRKGKQLKMRIVKCYPKWVTTYRIMSY